MNQQQKKQREAFLDTISENPGDEATRLAFADWLSEHDEPEYSDFMRMSANKYQEAVEMLNQFVSEVNEEASQYYSEYPEEEDSEGITHVEVITYNELLEALARRSYCFGFDTPSVARERRKELWDSYEIITGVMMTEGAKDENIFRCAC